MKFNNLFHDSSVNLEAVSRKRLMAAILIGLCAAFSIYSVFFVFKECYRITSFSFEYDPIIVEASNRAVYNLFFAYISLIFGNSIAISFLFRRPQNILSRRNTKWKRLLNDQVFLNMYFVNWFAKLGLMFGVYSLFMLDLQFLSIFRYLMILLVITMYLETWKTLVQVLKRKKFKYLLIHFVIVSILSFGLSQIELLDTKKMDEIVLKSNPIMDLPESLYSSNNKTERYRPTLKYKLLLDNNDSLLIQNREGKRMNLESLRYSISQEKKALREELMMRLRVSIKANRSIKIKHIKHFEAELLAANIWRINYEVRAENAETTRFESHHLSHRINETVIDYKTTIYPLPQPSIYGPPSGYSSNERFKDTIQIDISNFITYNNRKIEKNDLVKRFEKNIGGYTLFLYNLSSESSYQNYIFALSAHKKAISNLIQENASKGLDINKPRYLLTQIEKEELNKLKIRFPELISERMQYPK